METRRRRTLSKAIKWCCYALLLLLCAAAQTTPGLLQIGQAKPLYLLPLCLAVAAAEDEFSGAVFGMVCGLMWDYTAGRTVGMLALSLMILSFLFAAAVRLYLQCTALNFVLISTAAALLVLSGDFLLYYVMPQYAGAAQRYLSFVLPSAALTAPVSWAVLYLVRLAHERFTVNDSTI